MAAHGEARREFERLALLETDDCVVWPYSGNGLGHGRIGGSGAERFYVHREALLRRVPQPPSKPIALHGPCHNPACMNYRHLSWGTKRDNQQDRKRDGTYQYGVRAPGAKLDDAKVREIRSRRIAGESPQSIAASFNVRVGTIVEAVARRSWRHVA